MGAAMACISSVSESVTYSPASPSATLTQKLHGHGRLAGAGITLQQVQAGTRKAPSQDVIETGNAGRDTCSLRGQRNCHGTNLANAFPSPLLSTAPDASAMMRRRGL